MTDGIGGFFTLCQVREEAVGSVAALLNEALDEIRWEFQCWPVEKVRKLVGGIREYRVH